MSFVLDASAAVAWALADDSFSLALPALNAAQQTYAVAPVLWHFEVSSSLKKALADGRLASSGFTAFLFDLSTLDIRLEFDPPSMRRLLEVADRYRLSVYDASYLELAIRTAQPLATLDRDLAKAAHQAGVKLFLNN